MSCKSLLKRTKNWTNNFKI